MRILVTYLTIIFTLSINTYAESTLCFKKNVLEPNKIAELKLSGGNCKRAYSLNEMKKTGWVVRDTIITQNEDKSSNYIFIFYRTENQYNLYDNNLIKTKK